MIIKRSKWLIELLFIALFMWVAAGIFTSITGYLLYQPPAPLQKVDILPNKQKKNIKSKNEYNIIAERDLLQVAKTGASKTTAAQINPKDVPLAELGLILKGTIAGPKEIARAIIEDKGKQDSYKIGDDIKGGKIVTVNRNEVIIDLNGQLQKLVVEESKTKSKPTPLARRRSTAEPRDVNQPPGEPNQPSEQPSESPPQMDAGGMTSIMKNLDQYIGKARVVPYFKGGEPYGFRVSNVDQDAMIYELGVRSGDIIRSVNGIPIRTPEDAFNAYKEFQNASAVQVELERQGSTTTVSVPLQK